MGTLEVDCLSSLEQQVQLLSFKNQVSGICSGLEAWLLHYYYNVGEDPPDDKNDDREALLHC
jgi:hypothetical protein